MPDTLARTWADDQSRQQKPARRTIVITGNTAAAIPAPQRAAVDRRRPPRRARDAATHRPDRIMLWAVLMGLFLVLVAATSSNADDSGGARAGDPNSRAATRLGERDLQRGMSGGDVRTLQRLLKVSVTGDFDEATDQAVRELQRAHRIEADGIVGSTTRRALARERMRPHKASWYGPGFYGNRTACGQRMTKKLQGVAHKKLRCGSKVTLYSRGRFVTVKVVDRGPYARGISFDLTKATADALKVTQTEKVRAAY